MPIAVRPLALTIPLTHHTIGTTFETLASRTLIPRPLLIVLVYALPILIVAAVVVMSGYLLLQATGDQSGAAVMRWLSGGLLLLIVIDLVLLVAALGVNAIAQRPDRSDGSSE